MFFLGGGRQHPSETCKESQSPIEHTFEVSDHAIKMKQVNIVCFNLLWPLLPPQPASIHSYSCIFSERYHKVAVGGDAVGVKSKNLDHGKNKQKQGKINKSREKKQKLF